MSKSYQAVTSIDELREFYDQPSELVVKKQMSSLDKFSKQYISLSPFIALSTVAAGGGLDCSPRGDYPGFIKVLDNNTIAIPDRPGNNRLDTLENILETPQIGILLLIPGFSECLRINGSAIITRDSCLMEQFIYKEKLPKSVIVVSVEEAYFHCAKAIVRSGMWTNEAKVDRSVMPSLGRIVMSQIDPATSDKHIREAERHIEDRVKTTLY